MNLIESRTDTPHNAPELVKLESKRVPVDSQVVLKFDHFGGFFIDYAANLSLKGIFIKTDDPKPAGSIFIFEIWLGDERRLVHGIGEVVWVRRGEEGINRPAGMGIRYLKLDEESRQVIHRVVEEQLEKGGEVFDFDSEAREALGPDAVIPEDPVTPLELETLKTGEFLVVGNDEKDGVSSEKEEQQGPWKSQSARKARRRRRFKLFVLLLIVLGAAYVYLDYRGVDWAALLESELVKTLLASG
jgi:uncharacterized protein (TIGR02266 family)